MAFRLTAAGCACALLATAPALAQDDPPEIERQVEALTEKLGELDYRVGGFSRSGTLSQGDAMRASVQLEAGIESIFTGMCDLDCDNLDMTIRAPDGTTADSDALDDDVPVVAIQPAASGTYAIEIRMAACSAEPCHFRVEQFVK